MADAREPMQPSTREWTAVSTIADLLARSAAHTPDRRAVVFPQTSLTYLELLSRARDVARGLMALGVERGDHVGIWLPNGAEFIEAFFGAAYLGAVVVPLNPRYRSHELSYGLVSGDVTILLTTGFSEAYTDFPALLTSCAPELPTSAAATELAVDRFPRLRSIVLLGGEPRPGFVDRDEFLRLGAAVAPVRVEEAREAVRVRDVSVILFTSGTTANPKGCVLSHEAVTRGPVSRASSRFRTREHDVTWSAGPLYHMGSLQQLLGSIGTGGTFVTDLHFDAGRAIELNRRERPTISWALFPAIMSPILDHPDFCADDFADLRKIVLIGPPALLQRVQRTFPQAELITCCGMTELAGIYALSGAEEDAESRAETQGRPVPGVRVRIVGMDGDAAVSPGEPGEMWVQSPGMMNGYYKDDLKTSATIDGAGWLHTGDIYRQTDNGNLVFVGRLKDMLKVGGENVSAVEIEAFLCGHPDVIDAAVIGVPDPRLDEVPVAFVEVRSGASLSADELRAFFRGRTASYKIPREVHFVAPGGWPMSTTKIDKNQLRATLDEPPAGVLDLNQRSGS